MKNKLMMFFAIFFILFTAVCFAQEETVINANKKQNVNTIDFFYYGSGVDEDVMSSIIGKKPLDAKPATLHGYNLGIQGINDIPDVKVVGLKMTARELVKDAWGKDYQTYSAYKGGGEIRGIVWTINKEDLDLLRNWELVDYKWYSIVDGMVTFSDGKKEKVLTFAVKNQPIQKNINGMNYDPFFNKGQKFKETVVSMALDNR
jgi:hypothetical protein